MPAVVAVNRRPGRHQRGGRARQAARARGRRVRRRGQRGLRARAAPAPPTSPSAVVEACEQPNEFKPLYDDDEPIQDKIEAVAKRVYGASDVYFYPEAEKKLTQFTAGRAGQLPGLHGQDAPVALAPTRRCSTRRSTSRCPCATSAPTPARAGSCRCAATSRRCRASGKSPAALNVDIDAEGRTVGLF